MANAGGGFRIGGQGRGGMGGGFTVGEIISKQTIQIRPVLNNQENQ